MPLPKPDQELLRKILMERQAPIYPGDIFTPIQDAALVAIGDGTLTQARARNIIWVLENHPQIAAVFPNNLLLDALLKAVEPGGWTPEVEHDLLVFIFLFYSGTQEIEDSLWVLKKEPLSLFGDLYPAIYDTPTEPINLAGKVCDFTGSFACGPRRKCFEIVAAAGGASSEGGPGTDYLFVAEKHVAGRVVSGAIKNALSLRQQTGLPKIIAERYFPAPSQ